MDRLVQHYFTAGLAASSLKTYNSGIKKFGDFCSEYGIPSNTAIDETLVCRYVTFLAARGLSSATIKVYLSALRYMRICTEGSEIKHSEMPRLKYVSTGIKKTQSLASIPNKRQSKLPITPSILRKIRAVWDKDPHNYNNIMLWAVSTLGFFGFFRLGEILLGDQDKFDERLHLSAKDISIDSHDNPSMMQVHLKHSKTDQLAKGVNIIVGSTGNSLCPVAAMLAFLAMRGSITGPLFQFMNKQPLKRSKFVALLRQALTSAGIEAAGYTGHSFRVGAATTAAQCGVQDSTIQSLGRWKSDAYTVYIRIPKENLASVSQSLSNSDV